MDLAAFGALITERAADLLDIPVDSSGFQWIPVDRWIDH